MTGTAGGAPYRRLPGGISCIDAAYVAPGVACFYLVEGAGEYALVETGTAHSLPNLLTTLTDLGIARDQLRWDSLDTPDTTFPPGACAWNSSNAPEYTGTGYEILTEI